MINVVVNIKSIIKYLLAIILASALIFLAFSFFQNDNAFLGKNISSPIIDISEIETSTSLVGDVAKKEESSLNFFTKILDQTIPRNR